MASVRRQEMQVLSAQAQNADRTAAAAVRQNGTYLKNMPRIQYAEIKIILDISINDIANNTYLAPNFYDLKEKSTYYYGVHVFRNGRYG